MAEPEAGEHTDPGVRFYGWSRVSPEQWKQRIGPLAAKECWMALLETEERYLAELCVLSEGRRP